MVQLIEGGVISGKIAKDGALVDKVVLTTNRSYAPGGAGPTAADFPLLSKYNPMRNTLMLDWSPTEFSRLRLQLASDKSRQGITDHQVFLQYIYSLGAHGAHQF